MKTDGGYLSHLACPMLQVKKKTKNKQTKRPRVGGIHIHLEYSIHPTFAVTLHHSQLVYNT